jgi:3'-phosphoadenosine 5'-phosphosulfate (PAPS) 3'-phosphatase
MNSPKTVKICRLLNEAVVLNQQACNEIRKAHHFGRTKVFNKAMSSPLITTTRVNPRQINFANVVTDTDIKCQHIISSNLEQLYPKAKLVGEEDSLLKEYTRTTDTSDTIKPEMVQVMA